MYTSNGELKTGTKRSGLGLCLLNHVQTLLESSVWTSIKDVRTKERMGVCQMRTLLLIFACKMPKYADTGGKSFMDGPKFVS